MIIRSSKHILKYQTREKTHILERVFSDYRHDLTFYISKMISGEIDVKKFCSTKIEGIVKHSQWKQIILKNASEIIRSQIKKASDKRYAIYKKLYAKCIKNNIHHEFTSKKWSELKIKSILKSKYFEFPKIENITITLDSRIINFKKSIFFNEFIQINLPYFYENKKRALKLRLPIKHHKHSLKYKEWNRKNSVRLRKSNNNYFLDFIYEKEELIDNFKGNEIGIDQGYKKLLSDSNGNHYGREMNSLYLKISNKIQGSKNFKQYLKYRDNEINRIINDFFKQNNTLKTIFIEDLKNVKKKSKLHKKVMNKVQRWCYRNVIDKFERFCQENGIQLIKIDPAYTSQTCSNCGTVDKNSRNGEKYLCQHCKYEIDADTNAAINIYNRGVYNLSGSKNKPIEYFSI